MLKNQLTFVDLRGNPRIDEYYLVKSTSGYDSLEKLMDEIDKKCSKPLEDNDGFADETFDNKLKSYSAELWTSGRFSDFTIVANELSTDDMVMAEMREFHKNVLGLYSSVFAAMFENDMEENKTGRMKIVDFSASAVEQFLGFLYTGCVPDDVNAMELFALATKYDVSNLMTLSEEAILKNVGVENALDIFNLGHLYSSNALKQEAFQIQEMFPGKCLSSALINDPEGLKKLIDADRIRKVKTKEVDDELFEATMTQQKNSRK